MVLLRARLLGVPRFESGCGKLIANPGPKPTALIAYLASQADGRASRAELSQLLWGDARSTAAARQGLRQCILRLRQHFKDAGSIVRSDNSAIWLDLDLVEVDVRHLESIPKRGGADVVAAARLCNGTFCAMLEVDQPDFEAWLRQRRSEVDRLSARINSEAAELLAMQGRHEAAIRAARRHVAIEPFDEQAHAALIGLCMRFGRRQDARAAHAECLSVFRTELGIAPSAEIDAALQVVPFGTNRMPPSLPGGAPHRGEPFASAAVGAVGLMLAASVLLVISRAVPDTVPATTAETTSSTRMWVAADRPEIERHVQIGLFVDQDRVGTERTGNVLPNEAVQRAIAGDRDFAQYYPIGC
jgi:DNA-binding SARP family transcriptional activator